jgi:hypothetical protein
MGRHSHSRTFARVDQAKSYFESVISAVRIKGWAHACALGARPDQVPAIAIQVLEHGDLAIGLDGGRSHEADAGFGVGGEVAVEIVGVEEQEDAAGGLVADGGVLFGRGGAGEEEGGGVVRRVRRTDGDPALALLGDGRVLDEGEAELANVESERFVIVADDQGDVSEMGHGESICTLKVTGSLYTKQAFR